MKPRYILHTISRDFPDIEFVPQRFILRRSALKCARACRASIGSRIFRYELEDTRTGKRTEA